MGVSRQQDRVLIELSKERDAAAVGHAGILGAGLPGKRFEIELGKIGHRRRRPFAAEHRLARLELEQDLPPLASKALGLVAPWGKQCRRSPPGSSNVGGGLSEGKTIGAGYFSPFN